MTIRPDAELQEHIAAELFACPDVDETDIAVKVTNGLVALAGYVPDFFHKYGAEDAIKRVPGVLAVANDIEVQGTPSRYTADPQIARAALTAIQHALPQSWQQIRPIVRQGIVTLEGAAEWDFQRDLAEKAVCSLKGVTCIVNAIRTSTRARAP